jgi:hypothetical protein
MEEAGPTEGEEGEAEGAPTPPFGLPQRPLGCGALGRLAFALVLAPGFLLAPDDSGVAVAGAAGWATAALLALGLGAATGALVAARRRAAAAGRRVRPPLWVAFTALFLLGMAAAGLAGPLLLVALIAGG